MLAEPRYRRLIVAFVCLAIFVGACSDDDDSDTPSDDESPDNQPSDDESDPGDATEPGDDASASGQVSITIDGETWSFDSITCGFGEEETGVPGADLNAVASDGSVSLYVAAEGDASYIELADLETMDDGGLNYTTTGVGTPPPSIHIDGRSFSATAEFYSYNDMGGLDGPVEGTVSGSCP